MKLLSKLSVRIAAAIVIGFLFASAGTDISYTCTPIGEAAGCASFEKALMHPTDLLNNKQNSLNRFATAFVVTAVVAITLLSVMRLIQEKMAQRTASPGPPSL